MVQITRTVATTTQVTAGDSRARQPCTFEERNRKVCGSWCTSERQGRALPGRVESSRIESCRIVLDADSRKRRVVGTWRRIEHQLFVHFP